MRRSSLILLKQENMIDKSPPQVIAAFSERAPGRR
jgi:hypothetical protein